MPRPRKTTNNNTLLEAALEGLQLQKSRIEEQIADVRRMLGKKQPGRPAAAAKQAGSAAPANGRKRTLSSAARKRIAAAQKKRWAEYRKTAPKGE